jgi:hypothetical protein
MLNRLSSAVVPATPGNLDPNRYSFLTLNNAEPNLGVSAGNNYVVISNTDGSRDLKQIGTLLTAGAGITITANGTISVQPNINLDLDLSNITRTGVTRFDYVTATPRAIFNGNDLNGNPLEFTANDTVFVYIDGFLLQPTEDYSVAVGTGVSNVTLAVNSFANSIVSIVRFSPTLFGQGPATGGGGNATISGTIYASNVIEDGTTTTGNVFFTNTRARSAFTAGQNIILDANGLITGLVTAFSGNTDIIPEGVSNLYYTNTRVLANLASNPTTIVGNLIPSATTGRNLGNSTHKWNMSAQVFSIGSIYLKDISGNLIITNNVNSTTTTSISTSFIPEGSNLYYSNARAVAAVKDNISTSNIIEGANLYFTNTRSISSLIAGNNIVIEANGRVSSVATLGGAIPQLYTPNIIEVGNTTTGNVYFTNARAIAALTGGTGIGINSTGTVSVSGLTTTNVAEGTNQYFTTAKARDSLTAGTGIAYEALTGTIAVGGLSTDSVSEGSANLYFTNTRSISSLIAGNNIVIEANGRISSSATITGLPTIYTSNIVESGNTTTGNVYFTNARARAAFTFAPGMLYNPSTGAVYANVVSVAGRIGQVILSANDIVESGNTTTGNVYFTNTRAISAFTAGTGVAISNTGVISSSLTGVTSGVIADIANTATLVTGNIIPAAAGVYDLGSPTRPWRDVWLTGSTLNIGTLKLSQSANGGLSITNSNVQQANNPTFITDSIPEGSNLTSNVYFTNVRAIAAVRDNINTSNVHEGSNLYFTNTRAIYALTGGTGISISGTGTISSSVLNGGKLQGAIDASNVYEDGNTTSGNVFFNNARARAAFTAGNGIGIGTDGTITANVKSVNGKTGVIILYTGNVIESGNTTAGNVYFSNARARAAFTAGDNITITDGVIASTGGLSASDVGANIPTSGVTAGGYGNATIVPSFIVGANGIISSATNVAIIYPVTSVNAQTGAVSLITANVAEFNSDGFLYFSNSRARAAISNGSGISYVQSTGVISTDIISATDGTIRSKLSVNNANVVGTKGYGNVAYNSSTGVITYTRVSNVDIKDALSAGNGIVIEANGQILSTLTTFTNTGARESISATSANVAGTKGYGNVSYDSGTGVITYTRVSNVDIKDALKAGSGITIAADGTIATSATSYSDTNARGSISVANANVVNKLGYGNLTYDSGTGVITYTRVSNADIKSALSAGNGIVLEANGQILSTLTAFTDTGARSAIGVNNANVVNKLGYGNIAYDSSTGVITYTRVSNADIKGALSAGNGIVIEANGQILSTLTAFTDTGARSAISVTNANVVNKLGYGNIAYNSSTGVITYTRVSNADIKSALSAGNGIVIEANGQILSTLTAFSDTGARSAISVTNANVTGTKGYGNVAYNSSTGVITYTRVSNVDIKDALIAGSGIVIEANGRISSSSVVGTATDLQVSSLGVGTAASGLAGEIRATNDITAFYSSDRNLKTNIHVITNALIKLDDINGVSFDWNDAALAMYPDRTYNDIGVIAQEIEAVLPQVVTTRDTGYKAVKYEKIIPLLIQAIKELKSEVDTLKQQINTK